MFEALGDIEDPEEDHNMILATYRDGVKNVLGRSKKRSKSWTRDGEMSIMRRTTKWN